MKNEFVHHKNRLFLLLVLFIFAFGFVWLSVEQSIEFSMVQKSVINWASLIALCFIAQFGLAVFIGKMIRGHNQPENM